MASRIRAGMKVALTDAGDVKWITKRRVGVGYIGWLGRGNVGDEEMFKSFQAAASGSRVLKVPLTKIGRSFAVGTSVDLLVVGGGTLIGRPEWNTRIEEAIRVLNPKVLATAGTGVVFPGSEIESKSALSALEQSAQILDKFDHVTVRGPRSAATLSSIGIDAHPIGDLALIKPFRKDRQKRDQKVPRQNLVLVNLVKEGTPGRTLTPEQLTVLRAALLGLRSSGSLVKFFSMEMGDEEYAAQHFGGQFEIVSYQESRRSLNGLIGSASLVISERLHGSVLAARWGTPFLSLAYMAKVSDFVESLDCHDRLLLPEDLLDVEPLIVKCRTVMANETRNLQVDGLVAARVRMLDDFISGLTCG